VLVHGYGGAKSQWFLVERALLGAGFSTVRTMEYDASTSDIPALAERLCDLVRSLAAETGAPFVHLVGHSLGGVIIRYAVTVAGLDPLVGAAVTVASPHGGSDWARAGSGATAAQLRPGSSVLRRVESAARAGQARWLAFYADLDMVVAPSRARIRPAALDARNVMIPGEGHLTILLSGRLARGVVDQLASVDREAAAPTTPLPAPGPTRRPDQLARLAEAA
jgi:pimeloyl-ACP methyl ester carboxylesterase